MKNSITNQQNREKASSNGFTVFSQQIPFKDYLLANDYSQISKSLFLKDNPLELIRLSRRNGETMYRNFADKKDKGTLMEFIRNRSYEEGKIIPNKTLSSMMVAIEKAQNFIKANSKVLRMPARSNRIMVEENLLGKGIAR